MFSKTILVLASLAALSVAEIGIRTPAYNNVLVARDLISGRQSCPTGFFTCPGTGKCAENGSTCCSFGGTCRAGTFCDVPTAGESGEPGCCPDGENCNEGGGINNGGLPLPGSTLTSTATATAAVEEPSTTAAVEEPSTTEAAMTTEAAVPIVGTGSAGVVAIPTNGTFPTATGIPPTFTGGAVKGAVPAAAMGIVALAGFFGMF